MQTAATEHTTWTILSLLNWSVEYFIQKGIDSPRLTTELLLSHVLGCERIRLYTDFDKPLSTDELAQFKALLRRRLAHEPVQYILGEAEFMGLRLYIDQSVLIPRPETELLVEETVALVKRLSLAAHILDVGTGSGNIAIGIARFLVDAQIDAIDISDEALAVAAKNISRHHFTERIHLRRCDILNEKNELPRHAYDLVVTNPPYVSAREFNLLQPEVKLYEPSAATTDGADGLTFYRTISRASKELLKKEGWILMEVGYNQADDVENIFHREGFNSIERIKDFAGIERIIKARMK